RAERTYARTGYPADARGRRAHYWVVPYGGGEGPRRGSMKPAVWGTWITGKNTLEMELRSPLAYVGFGLPGRAAEALGAHGGWDPPQEVHRWAVRSMKEGPTSGFMQRFYEGQGELSLREYVRGRYGDAAL